MHKTKRKILVLSPPWKCEISLYKRQNLLYNYVENMSDDHLAADGFSDGDTSHTDRYAVLHDYAPTKGSEPFFLLELSPPVRFHKNLRFAQKNGGRI